MLFPTESFHIASQFDPDADAVLFHGDRLDLLSQILPRSQKLIVTSPPYNIGKAYEKHYKMTLDDYLEEQR